MSYYTIEQWTVKDVAKAFMQKEESTTNRRVVIPIFQRGLRWESKRRTDFIDSINKGYPFGCLLFAKNKQLNTYSVVDGLQRGTTVCDYVYNPLNRNNFEPIEKDILIKIRQTLFPGSISELIDKDIEKIISDYYDSCKTFDKVDNIELVDLLFKTFATEEDKLDCLLKINEFIKPMFEKRKEKYENICSAIVPIVMYSGPNELLSEIFNRINVKGIALNNYEIYAAVWDQKKMIINNGKILQKVVNKYISIKKNEYTIDGFNADDILTNKKLTAFEYLFGLGKYWSEDFSCLKINEDNKDDTVNEISFEIIDACINDTKDIQNLDKTLFKYDVNKLQEKIEEAIDFVSDTIAIVSQFKGNKRKSTVLHSKYQIISLISSTFRQMYNINDLTKQKQDWQKKKDSFRKNLVAHYVVDIISNEWHDGGGSKVYKANNNKKYLEEVSKERLSSLIDGYYQRQLSNKQSERFTNPTNADSVILNCVYVNLFTASDQLSYKKFDIEHLATKEKMKNIIKLYPNLQMPVSCIANLCYLPEDINRGKREKTIYEANNLSISIEEIEEKYSFTSERDLKWILKDYSIIDVEEFKNDYYEFINNRYEIISKRFLAFFGY